METHRHPWRENKAQDYKDQNALQQAKKNNNNLTDLNCLTTEDWFFLCLFKEEIISHMKIILHLLRL